MKKLLKLRAVLLLFSAAVILLTGIDANAYPNGFTGRTKKTSFQGCGSCHAGPNSNLNAVFSGPDTVNAGATVTFNVQLTASGIGGKGGVDIAALNGTLAPGTGLKLQSGELTHTAGFTFTSSYNLSFSYTAPNTPGADTLYITAAKSTNAWNWGANRRVIVRLATGIGNESTPVSYSLKQNYPNPFNPVTKISFSIPKQGFVTLKIYDILGNEVSTLVNENRNAGNYDIEFKGDNLSSGVYYYKLESGGFTDIKKMTLIK